MSCDWHVPHEAHQAVGGGVPVREVKKAKKEPKAGKPARGLSSWSAGLGCNKFQIVTIRF